jgi:hypothetical protein
MSRKPWGIKPTEVERAIKVAQKKGLDILEIKFGKGIFSIVTGKPAEADASAGTPEDLKELL